MRGRAAFTTLAIVLGLVGLVLGGIFVARMPRTMTVAVGPAELETHRYAMALANASREAKDRFRYQIVTTSGAAESARLLEEGKVNLAIIRSDVDLPANGQTLLVNTKRLAIIFAPRLRRGGIQTFADLKGKRIAVTRLTDPNLPLVKRMLAVAEIAESDVTLIEMNLAELPDALAQGRVDAAISVVVPSAPQIAETIQQIARRLPNGIRFIPITEAEAMVNRIIGLETAELPAGTFGAARPQEEVQTVAISYRTMARSSMPNAVAGDVAKSLFDLRTRLARQVPIAFTAEAPDAKTGARLPVHPGAQAYFDGESRSFFERNGELLLTVVWGASLLGSALTGFLAWVSRKRHQGSGQMLEEIAELTARARAADATQLGDIEGRIDAIVREFSNLRSRGHITDAIMESASLALEHFRGVADVARSRRG